MDRQKARDIINAMDIRNLYQFEKYKGNMYCCPVCGSGKGEHKTGALLIRPGRKIHCYSNNCFSEKGEDNLGALRIIWQCSEEEVFSRVLGADWAGKNDISLQAKKQPVKAEERGSSMTDKQALDGWMNRTKKYIADAIEAIKTNEEAIEYLKGRGFTEETIEKFDLGYASTFNGKPNKGIVIPYNRAHTYCVMRKLDDNASPKYLKLSSEYNGKNLNVIEPVFNIGALCTETKKPVFVVESQLCAISIMQAVPSAMAVSVGGTGSEKLINAIEERKASDLVYILCFDNDKPGQDAQKALSEKLEAKQIKSFCYNIAGAAKDPNEALVSDEGGLIERIYEALEVANEARKEKEEEYITNFSSRKALSDLLQKVNSRQGNTYISTGFDCVDSLLEGGLYPGLYVIGAISSLGKTTFCMQIMDNIAAAGNDVLIFSLEMDVEELVSKSISRHTFQRVIASWGTDKELAISNAKTYRGIADGSRYDNYSLQETNLIKDSFVDYARYAKHIFITEGNGELGVSRIREAIQNHITITGRKPVVFIDYLQIIAPYKDPEAPNRSLTDKQAVDKNVMELKRISRDFSIPVLTVSSLNRAGYNTSTNMTSFKESGAIEYSSDTLIGLEYNGIKESELDELIEKISTKADKYEPTEIKLKILKQRAGARGGSCILDYYQMFNFFTGEGQEIQKPKEGQETFYDVTDDIDVPF